MKTQIYFLIIITSFILSACKSATPESKLNHVLIDSITIQLKSKQIDSVFITGISMKSGKITISINAEKTNNKISILNTSEIIKRRIEPKEMFIPFSILNILQTGNVKEDDLTDTFNGSRSFGNTVINDNSFYRGGYGTITLKECIPLNSNIGTVAFSNKAFKSNESFYAGISNMNLSIVTDLNSSLSKNIKTAIGSGFKVSTENLIKDFAAIAYNENINNNYEIKKDFIKLRKINCSEKVILQVREMLIEKGKQFRKQFNIPETSSIGGMSCTDLGKSQNVTPVKYICYFFPVENPEYIYFISCFGKIDDTTQLLGAIINSTLALKIQSNH